MEAKLQDQLNAMCLPPTENHVFSVQNNDWIERPHENFMDLDFQLPFLKRTDNGYKSNTVVVLTSRSSANGRLLESCLGYVQVKDDTEQTDYQSSLEWHSDDGEEVVGWMPVPVFHLNETTTLHQNPELDKGFVFGYSE